MSPNTTTGTTNTTTTDDAGNTDANIS